MSDNQKREAKKTKKKKKISALAVIVICLVCVMFLLVAVAVTLYISGRNSIESSRNEAVNVPVIESDPEEAEEVPSQPDNSDMVIDTFSVRKNGKVYTPRENVLTFLALGVDSRNTNRISTQNNVTDSRADMIMLCAIDMDTGKMSFITVSRDTMCSFRVCDEDGNYNDIGSGQLALSYRYGDGMHTSCEATRDAVSTIFGGINIKAYGALFLDGIEPLNQAVGCVTLTLDEDWDSWNGLYKAGTTITLSNSMARNFVRSREHTETGNLERMSHQRTYFKALLRQIIDIGKDDVTEFLKIYNTISQYVVTDLSINEITYLATQVLKLDLSMEFYNVPGEVQLSDDSYAEYYIDQEGLTEILLEVYYKEA